MKKETKKPDNRRSEFSYIYKGVYVTVAHDEDDLLYYAYYQRTGEKQEEVPGMAGMQTPTGAGKLAEKYLNSLGL